MEHALENISRKLKFKTINDEFNNMNSICIGCYRFLFKKPMTKSQQYNFFCFTEVLDTSKGETGILCIGIYLLQERIPFTLKFKYNNNLSFHDNFILWFHRRPKLLNKVLHDPDRNIQDIKLPERKRIHDTYQESCPSGS